MFNTHPLLYSAHLCCSVDSQGQGKCRRCANQVQCWAFLASKPNALDELFDVECLSVDNVTESQELMSQWRLWKKSVSFHHLEFWTAPTSPILLIG